VKFFSTQVSNLRPPLTRGNTPERRQGFTLRPCVHLFSATSPIARKRRSATLIESCADGWWYSALLPSRERIVAFFSDPDLVERRALLSPDGGGMMAAIARTRHLRDVMRSSGYAITARPRGADASSSRLDRAVGRHWIAAGDAALSFDPLSSQGIFNAMYTGMQAGRALDAALAGDDTALTAYAVRIDEIHRHYRHNLAAAYAMETRWPEQDFWRRRIPDDYRSRPNSPSMSDVASSSSR
jgi:2-polyprenyl-6-methoxyphenol hydroxylase-like FAD-dependent oxidoreductase